MNLDLDRWRPVLPALLLGALVAFVGLGWRGIWDPDEGRYTNVAIQMLKTGDFLHPHRHHETGHWTKPPLTYWAIAGSLALFGPHPFAARLPAALAFLFSILLVFAMARALLPGSETLASVIYATSFLPFAAPQIITTDYLLAAFVTLAVYGWVRARFAQAGRALDTLDTSSLNLRDHVESGAGPEPNPSERPFARWRRGPAIPGRRDHRVDPSFPRAWIALMWAAFGLAFLTKGPPALLPLAAILAFHWTSDPARRPRIFDPLGLVLFAAIALPRRVDTQESVYKPSRLCRAGFGRRNSTMSGSFFRVLKHACAQPRARSSRAATAGSTLPSRNSRKAPPPVEM